MIKRIVLAGVVIFAMAVSMVASIVPAQAATGFHISNGRLLDANGNDFVMRGINHPYIWFTNQNSSFANIKAAGANTVRVVLNNTASTSTVSTAVTQCKNNKLVCVLEVHDTTGYPKSGSITLSQAADYWLRVKSAFVGQEKYVIVNLGNEPYGSATDTGWISQTETAISKLRNGGVSNTLMADAPAWGQDSSNLMRNNAGAVFNSDSQKNVIFSVHMYSVYASASTVTNYINYFANNHLPLVVGEFGWALSGNPVAWSTVMSATQSRSIGWMAWSWSGNGGSDAPLDMTNNFNPNSLTGWGNSVINGGNGLKATSKQASIYANGAGTAANGYPYCVNGSSSDPDGDGWGWENNASCVVKGSPADG
jgi:mannan endo-1,4-beta-mannosidase